MRRDRFACRFGARINAHGYVSRSAGADCTAANETHIKAVDKRKGALIVSRSSIHEVAGYGCTYVLRCTYTERVHVCTHAMRLPVCACVFALMFARFACVHGRHGRQRVLPRPCVVTAHTR